MKRNVNLILAAFCVAAMVPTTSAGEDKDGKSIFLEYKCRSCHSVNAQGIVKKATDEEEDDSKKESPDLSSVGLDRKSDWISKFLLKKEAIDGEKHKKKFKGSDEELAILAKWLEEQKAPKKKK